MCIVCRLGNDLEGLGGATPTQDSAHMMLRSIKQHKTEVVLPQSGRLVWGVTSL